MIVLTLFFVIPFERTDLCDIICSQLHINNLIEFGKSLTLSSWRCFLVWLVDRVVHLLSSWGWIATRDYSELPFPQLRNGKGVKKIHSQNSGTGREWKKSIPKIREREGNEKNPFPKFGNGKGMKKSIPKVRERESEASILWNDREREFPLTPGTDTSLVQTLTVCVMFSGTWVTGEEFEEHLHEIRR